MKKDIQTGKKHRLLALAARIMLGASAVGAIVPLALVNPLIGLLCGGLFLWRMRPKMPPLVAWESRILLNGLNKRNHVLEADDPLYARIATLAARAGVDMPHVLVTPAALHDISAVSYSTRTFTARGVDIIRLPEAQFYSTLPGRPAPFTAEEQDAIIAHELIHLKNRDSAVAEYEHHAMKSLIVTGFVGLLAGMALGAVPIGAVALSMTMLPAGLFAHAFARQRVELLTDAESIALTGNAAAMDSALRKMYKLDRHFSLFEANAQQITRKRSFNIEIIKFKPLRRPVDIHVDPVSPAMRIMHGLLAMHPQPAPRLANIKKVAQALQLHGGSLQEPDMDEFLPPVTGNIVLPPFAQPDTLHHDLRSPDRLAVVTLQSRFNKVAFNDDDNDPSPFGVTEKPRPPATEPDLRL